MVPSQKKLLFKWEFEMHDKSSLHLCPVIWHHFHVIEHWEDPLRQLLCSRLIKIIINKLGVSGVKNLSSKNNTLFHEDYDKNYVVVMNVLAHIDVDCEL